jgi:membrane-associated phospholipid phosphatase
VSIGLAQYKTKEEMYEMITGPFPKWASVRLRLLAAFFALLPITQAFAGEKLFNSASIIEEEASYLRDEALDVLRTPTDTEHNGLFGTVMVAAGAGMVYIFDENIRKPIREHGNQTLDKIANVGSSIGNPLLHIGMAGMVYGGGVLADSQKWQETGKMLGEAVLLADAATLVLKESIGRGRPYVNGDKGNFKPLQFDSDYDSLPSMHTASSFAAASIMSGASESLWAKAAYYSAATFVGLSRMVDDQHWASDVILGAAIGELCGRIVARHHANGKRKFVLAPIISGNSAFLALSAKW